MHQIPNPFPTGTPCFDSRNLRCPADSVDCVPIRASDSSPTIGGWLMPPRDTKGHVMDELRHVLPSHLQLL